VVRHDNKLLQEIDALVAARDEASHYNVGHLGKAEEGGSARPLWLRSKCTPGLFGVINVPFGLQGLKPLSVALQFVGAKALTP